MPEVEKTVVAVVKSVASEEKGGKDVISFQVMRDGMKFPDYITAWPDQDGNIDPTARTVRNGQRYAFLVAAKPKPNGKGEYLNFLGLGNAKDAPKAANPPRTASNGASAPAGAASSDSRDPRERSIERQVALKAAVEMGGYWIAKGREVNAKDTIIVAGIFADWLAGAHVGRMAPKRPAAAPPAASDEPPEDYEAPPPLEPDDDPLPF